MWTAVREAWPGVSLSRERFERQLANETSELSAEGLAELYLACACASGDRKAMAIAEAEFVSVVPTAIAHMRLSPNVVDEVQQAVRSKLLLSVGEAPPRIVDYAGKGKLRGLVKVMAVRTAISTLRKDKRHAPQNQEALLGLASPELGPEFDVLKATYKAEFSTSFEESVASLSSRERNILRLQLLDKLTVSEVAALYKVDRATVTRWLTKIRSALLSETRKRMQTRLGIKTGELDSIMRLIESRLDVSVQRMLESRDE